jgi:hypothetical protein
MNKTELRDLAIKKLNTKEIKKIKTQISQMFSDRNQEKECITEFDKNFIKSFIRARQNRLQ